ncbi:S66 peptidase family protein [Aquimarina agarilytica]|uniref:S66 peptidase family protein n=1 Tax=Aquimarina agarilytica TaxID=1087449 RepID=UPI000288209E|nr:LD-carboxypeptidase [Aquimarina agarilytica]
MQKSITIPAPLKKGDTVAIVATARKISLSEIDFAINWLKSLGYKVLLGKTIELAHHQFAGTDVQRATDLQNMLNNPEIKAIWCARGGYGSVRIIDKVDFSVLTRQPKWLIGYSDVTAIHSHLNQLNMATIHASMPIDIEKSSIQAKETLVHLLQGKNNLIDFGATPKNKIGQANGIAIGGNLSMLYSLCGSISAINTKGKILFLEDLDEYLYHIDRMLQNLDRNGLFKDLSGLVIGAMTNMHDNSIPFGYTVKEMILEITKTYDYPIIFDAPFGHIKDNRAIAFGKEISLEATNEKSVLIQQMN